MTRAFVFPGQGSQVVGMGRALADAFPSARAVFEEVDDALGEHLSRLIFEGPEDELKLTQNTQPALMTVSLAAARAIESESGKSLADLGSFVAGHSLGEYSALAAARALPLAETARLLRIRGLAMQKAVPVGEGAMAAVLGLDLDVVEEITKEAAEGEIVQPANDNGAGQVVISGAKAAVERATALVKARGKKSMPLPVSAPFHCKLMQPAADAMAEALEKVVLAPPTLPLIANVTATPTSDPETIRRQLVEQVTGLVRWRETVEFLAAREIATQVEVGAGKVLAGIAKRIAKDMALVGVGTPQDLEAFLKTL
ncbi:ACP S-malonyltransferase [Zavarzinia sp. CC-PAN008]|uniref:ACP S-malonyltransferase n=1 Tax=Zavarzinia sp. CC-PAN008 TaxID=3243332 RepID=UPI003F749597